MGKNIPVLLCVDREMKTAAKAILAESGLTLSDAFDLFLRQIVAEQGMPLRPRPQEAVSVRVLEAFLDDTEPDTPEASRREFDEERSLRQAVENSRARELLERTGVLPVIRAEVQAQPNAD